MKFIFFKLLPLFMTHYIPALTSHLTLKIIFLIAISGRSFLHIPQDLGANLKSDVPPEKCFIPKRQIHEWKGHSKGVAAIRWFPKSGHLILSGAMDSKVKIWEVYKNRR